MGRIDLKKNSGVRVQDKAMPHTIVNSNTGLGVVQAFNHATDSLVRGMQHVSGTVMRISDDMKQKDIHEETMYAQIEYFDKTQNAMRELAEQNIYDQTEYENAFNEAMDKVDADMLDWAKNNASWDESRDAIALMSTGGRSKAYAQAMGQFISQKNTRKSQLLEHNYNRLVQDKNINGVEVLMKNSGLAPETQAMYIEKAKSSISAKEIADLQYEISLSTDLEHIYNVFDSIQYSDAYMNVDESTRSRFDVFAIAKMESIAQAEEVEEARQIDAQSKAVEKQNKAIEKEVNDLAKAYEDDSTQKSKKSKEAIEGLKGDIKTAVENRLGIDWVATENRFNDVLKNSNFSDDIKKKYRGEFDVFKANTIADIEKNKNKALKRQAFIALEKAMENGGVIDSKTLNDTPADISYRQRFKAIAEKPNEASVDEKIKYSHKYHLFEKEIFAYNEKEDFDGRKLATILREAQNYPDAERTKLIKTIDTIVNKRTPNPKWTTDDVEVFKEKFNRLCTVGDDRLWFGNDEIAGLNNDLYNRIYNRAEKLNLTLTEALHEIENDPYFKYVMGAEGRALALELVNRK